VTPSAAAGNTIAHALGEARRPGKATRVVVRVYTVRSMVMASLIFMLFSILVAGILFGVLMLKSVIAVRAAVAELISYLITGALGPVLAEQVAKTGVLNGTALGRQRQWRAQAKMTPQPQTRSGRFSLASWRTRDLLLTAVIALTCGVLFSGVFFLYAVVLAAFPLGAFAFAGMAYFGPFLIAYVVRRPGAVVVGQVVGGLAAIPFHPAGLAVLIGFALYGLISLLALWLGTRFRDFGRRAWGSAALIAATGNLLWNGLVLGSFSLTAEANLLSGALALASCVGFAFAARGVAQALFRAGVLRDPTLAPGQEAEI
jgi:ABC-type thiamin/hydroxymethylpyrimidine transport system permease subunit